MSISINSFQVHSPLHNRAGEIRLIAVQNVNNGDDLKKTASQHLTVSPEVFPSLVAAGDALLAVRIT